MKKFLFRLESVLEQREKKEQEAMLVQVKAEQLYQERLGTLEQIKSDFNRALTDSLNQDPTCKLHYIMYQDLLKDKITKQANQVQQAKEKLDQARHHAIEARKERKTLEKLKERHWEDYISQLRQEENKQTDEMATGMHNRKQHPAG
ncbi:MAG: hypothetical protein FH758_04775 [Firmicutes bacterium]|nr:hypothetical protein [Bacillota bacterium]